MIAVRPRWRMSSWLHRMADRLVAPEIRVLNDAVDRDVVLAEVEIDLLEARLGGLAHRDLGFYQSLVAWLVAVEDANT